MHYQLIINQYRNQIDNSSRNSKTDLQKFLHRTKTNHVLKIDFFFFQLSLSFTVKTFVKNTHPFMCNIRLHKKKENI